ncbi:MAG: nucleoside hydrolase [Gemmatales bacterium]
MAKKTIIIGDPGIDTAFALALGLFHPQIDVVAVAASAGNVSAEQASENVYNLIEHFDPVRLPRIGQALPVSYEPFGKNACSSNGLGGLQLPRASKLHSHPGDKVIVEEARKHHHDIHVAVLGPATMLSRALERDPELPLHLKGVVIVGGTCQESGDAGPVTECHFHADAASARRVLQCGVPIVLIPLDISRRFAFSPAELDELLGCDSSPTNLLRRMLPGGLRASAEHYGIEGLILPDLAGICWLLWPQYFSTKPKVVDIETRGELTQGMCVIDNRNHNKSPNVELVIDADLVSLKAELHKAFHGFTS